MDCGQAICEGFFVQAYLKKCRMYPSPKVGNEVCWGFSAAVTRQESPTVVRQPIFHNWAYFLIISDEICPKHVVAFLKGIIVKCRLRGETVALCINKNVPSFLRRRKGESSLSAA